MKKGGLVLFIAGMVLLIFAVTQPAGAKLTELIPPKPSDVPDKFVSVQVLIREIFNIIITISGAVFMILLIVGGIQYLTGAGNEEATGKAKRLMIDAIIGLIIVLAAWAAGSWILTQLQPPPDN